MTNNLEHLSVMELNYWDSAITSLVKIRELAITEQLSWTKAKAKYLGGICLFCAVNNQSLLSEARRNKATKLDCHCCLWEILTSHVCHDYHDHEEAIARYNQWQHMIATELTRRHADVSTDNNQM